MSRVLSILMIVIAAGLAWVWFVTGPSVLIGGPGKSDIVAVTRATLAGPPGTTTEADVATFTPKGLCSRNEDGSFACIVEMTIGETTKSAVIALQKDAAGNWVAVD